MADLAWFRCPDGKLYQLQFPVSLCVHNKFQIYCVYTGVPGNGNGIGENEQQKSRKGNKYGDTKKCYLWNVFFQYCRIIAVSAVCSVSGSVDKNNLNKNSLRHMDRSYVSVWRSLFCFI